MDDQDLFIEKLNPENPEEYLTPNGYKPFVTRQSIINVKGQRPVTVTLRWSANGPVLPGNHYDLAAITPKSHVAALSWTMLTGRDTSMTSALRLMRAGSIEEAIAAGRLFVAPSQNLMLTDGTRIAMKTIGAMPLRHPRHQTKGRMPSPGWIPQNRWQGIADYGRNPEFTDPPGGILGNTNNKTVDRPFPFHVSYLWGDSQRIFRWKKLMMNREVHTRESFIEAQLDTVSFTARSLLPLVGRDLWFTGEPAPEGTPERRRQIALEMLAGWNGEMNEHMPEPLIYAAWMRALQKRLIRDEIGPLSEKFDRLQPLFIERVYRDTDGASKWCDVIQSEPEESCTDIARLALDDALLWIGEHFGRDLASLRWGDAHQATHDHKVLGKLPVLRHFVNIRQAAIMTIWGSCGGGGNISR